MFLQITSDSVTTSQTLTVTISVIGSLLVLIAALVGYIFVNTWKGMSEKLTNEIASIHKRIDTRQEDHENLEEKHRMLHIDYIEYKAKNSLDHHKIAELVVSKLHDAKQ